MLSNLETEKSKLLQIVLVGQPEPARQAGGAGARAAAAADHGQLSPAAARRGGDRPLHQPPAAPRRARRAARVPARRDRPRFTRAAAACRAIINVICDAALVFGYAEERRQFDAALVADVLARAGEARACCRGWRPRPTQAHGAAALRSRCAVPASASSRRGRSAAPPARCCSTRGTGRRPARRDRGRWRPRGGARSARAVGAPARAGTGANSGACWPRNTACCGAASRPGAPPPCRHRRRRSRRSPATRVRRRRAGRLLGRSAVMLEDPNRSPRRTDVRIKGVLDVSACRNPS